jgi:CRP-like cAMP-binding protein
MEVFEVVVALLLGGAALAAAFTQAIEALGSAFAGVLAHYTQVWCIQLAQHAVCNRVHRVVERCARWLLQTQDRVGRAAFPLTQEFLAMMLGAQRPSVTDVARQLQQGGQFAQHLHSRVR